MKRFLKVAKKSVKSVDWVSVLGNTVAALPAIAIATVSMAEVLKAPPPPKQLPPQQPTWNAKEFDNWMAEIEALLFTTKQAPAYADWD